MHRVLRKESHLFSEERFTKQTLFSDKNHTMFVLNFLPGQQLPAHRHPGKDVFLLGLEGTGSCQIGEETVSLAKGDFIHLVDDNEIAIANDSEEPISIYVILHNKKE